MTDKELRRLSRRDLMEILYEQGKEIETLRAELAAREAELEDRRIMIENSGSIAEAALKLNGVFEAAQAACEQYSLSLKTMGEQQNDEKK